ncbi:MAG: hypothetical protein VKJ63_04640 [Synechococcus sp.]|nr:hypothetical protein [Synechococcus sp.]
MAAQLLRGHLSHFLELPVVHPAVRQLWAEGLYPFGPPFVASLDGLHVPVFPWTFPLLSAPFLALMGWRGLYVVPALGIVLLWAWMAALLGSVARSRTSVAAALFALVFASPATLYAAMFWEHSMAMFLASLALIILVPLSQGMHVPKRLRGCQSRPAVMVGFGVLSGLGIFLRPELLAYLPCALFASILLLRGDRQLRVGAFALGVCLSLVGFLVFNVLVYGVPLGQHSLQVIDAGVMARSWAWTSLQRTRWLSVELLRWFPPLVAVAVALPLVLAGPSREGRTFLACLLVVVVSVPAISAIVPSDGGKQLGPRFLMVLLPLCVVLVGLAVDALMQRRRQWQRALALLVLLTTMALGFKRNAWDGARTLREDYAERVLPALRAIEEQPQQFILVSHQYIAQELARLADTRAFLWPRRPEDLSLVRSRLLADGITSVLVVAYRTEPPPPVSFAALTLLGQSRNYVVYRAAFAD